MNTQIARIPVTLVTGFLGSGKTTLINRLLSEAHGKRIAIVENEFGEVSIDDALLLDANQTIFKMSNGCLCCTISGDLVRTLLELADRRQEFDYVIIETTGIANPSSVIQTFMLNEDIAEAFELDAVVTLADARHLELHLASKECKEQVALADIILLNKVDLVSEAEALAVEARIRSLNRLAVIHRTERSNLHVEQILDQKAFSRDVIIDLHDEHEEGHHHEGCGHGHCDHDHGERDHGDHDHGDCDHDHGEHGANQKRHLHSHRHDEDIQSAGFEIEGSFDLDRFNRWFGSFIHARGDEIYRCKGILSFHGRAERVVVQTVHRVSEVTTGDVWADGKRLSKIVFIGKNLDRAQLLADLTACLQK